MIVVASKRVQRYGYSKGGRVPVGLVLKYVELARPCSFVPRLHAFTALSGWWLTSAVAGRDIRQRAGVVRAEQLLFELGAYAPGRRLIC